MGLVTESSVPSMDSICCSIVGISTALWCKHFKLSLTNEVADGEYSAFGSKQSDFIPISQSLSTAVTTLLSNRSVTIRFNNDAMLGVVIQDKGSFTTI